MHLLVFVSILPDGNPSTGYEIANQAILDAYRRENVRLTLIGYRRPGSPIPDGAISLGEFEIENAAVSAFRKASWVARAIRMKLPVMAAKVACLGQGELEAKIAEAGPIDGIVFSSTAMATAYPFLFDRFPSIFIAHNVEHRSAAENAEHASSPIDRVLYRREAQVLERAEAFACAKACVVHTLSADDRAGLDLGGDPRAIDLPLVIGRKTAPDDGRRRQDVGLIGTWSWAPNRIGLDWFLSDVVPLLPIDFSVAIAGRIGGDVPKCPPNVRFLGRIDSAEAFVRRSRVVALATKAGTGIQLKTLETFEEGMPAVATTKALRGVAHLPANVRQADRAADFARALIELVEKERDGKISRLDGRDFAHKQRGGLDAAIAEGLARLAEGRGAGAEPRELGRCA